MFRLNEIRTYLTSPETRERGREKVKQLIKASESPSGFAAIAAIGLGLILLLNTGDGDTPETPQALSVPQTAAAQHEGDMAPDDATAATAPIAERPAQKARAKTYKLKRNETLLTLLDRAGISNKDAHKAVNALKDVTNLRRLQRGQEVRIIPAVHVPGRLQELRLRDSFQEEAILELDSDNYVASRATVPTLPLTHLVEGEITDSLYLSAQRAGLPTPVIVELIRLMSFDVDFEREIRTGDRFQVYFERDYAPTFGDIDEGRILHMKLELQKRTLEATYFEDEDGRGDYFDSNGHSTRKTLMKTPLDVTVVTSNYGKRKHPVLGYTRLHAGVDFRAWTGTPIMAAGDGTVERANRYGSYGNYIRIRHNGTYKTAYAHLSRFGKGIKSGARVKQGQIIGYSGATGRVNGPHLHYEVLVNGKQTNPLTLKLPTGKTLKGEQLAAFQEKQNVVVADISKIILQQQFMLTTQTAANDPDATARANGLANMGDR